MTYTVYSSIEDPENGTEIVSEYRTYSDYDAADAAKDDLHEALDDGTVWISTWIEDEHGNMHGYSSDRGNWNEMMDEIYTEPHGY